MSEGFVIEKKVLKKYEGPGGAVDIPEGVEEIGFQAFKDQRGVMSVKFPKSLKRLRKEAFAGCAGLSRLVLPECVEEIGAFAFVGCAALTEAVLPESLTEIGDSAFKDCAALQKLNLPAGLRSIKHAVFRNCAALPDLVLPEGLLEIGWCAFEGCKAMETLTIPASVRLVEGRIVQFSGIRQVTFSGGRCNINKDAFNLYSGGIDALHIPVGCFGSPDAKRKAIRTFAKAFLAGTELDPDVKASYLDYIRKRRKDLYQDALEQEDLMQLMVQEKVIPRETIQELLDQCANEGRNAVMALLLEYSKSIPPLDPVKEAEKGFQAMERETKALEAYRETGVLTVALAKKEWRYGSDGENGVSLNGWKGEGQEAVTPKGIGRKPVTEIGPNAFFRSKVTRVTVSEGVLVIQDGAFWDCKNLTRITLPESLKILASSVFMGCAALTEIRLPGKLKRIGPNTFSGCESLREIVIPKKVKEISWCAFANCHSLERVTIPASVGDISLAAFTDCPRLTIRAPAGSYAEAFAKENNIPFEEIQTRRKQK